MANAIDVLIIDPVPSDACKTVNQIRRKAPSAVTVRVLGTDQAERLMFDHGLFSVEPQIPSLIILDLGATGESGINMLRRLRTSERARRVPIVIFSAQRNDEALLYCHLLGVQMNLLKPSDPKDYQIAVDRIMTTWLSRGFIVMEPDERATQRMVMRPRNRNIEAASAATI